jgi:hypothetical protein
VQSIADALKVSADSLYEQAGVNTDDGPGKVVEAILEDPNLTARQRQSLIEIYQSFAGTPARSRRRRSSKSSEA